MGLSIKFEDAAGAKTGPFQFATLTGWGAFGAWAESLPPGPRSEPLAKLYADGYYGGTDKLSAALRLAVRDHPPPTDGGADTVAAGLLRHVGVGSPDEAAVVTGLGGEDDDEDFHAGDGDDGATGDAAGAPDPAQGAGAPLD